MPKTTVAITLARTSNGTFNMEITDEVSRARILGLTITPEQFADMLSARYTPEIKAEVYSDVAEHWGTHKQEQRTVVFDCKDFQDFPRAYAEAAAAQEAEGWHLATAEKRDGQPYMNPHFYSRGMYTTSAWRWIDA